MEVTVFLVVATGVGIIAWLNQKKIKAKRSAFIDDYTFPPAIERKLKERYTHLEQADIDLAVNGLREYFHVCLEANNTGVAMPSQAVDVLWHEFILFTREYEIFCQQAFGRFLHHTPAEAMTSPTSAQIGIRRAWKIACQRQGISPTEPLLLPTLFAIDERLAIPDGFTYQLDCTGKEDQGFCASHIAYQGDGGGCIACSGSRSDGGLDGCGSGCGGD